MTRGYSLGDLKKKKNSGFKNAISDTLMGIFVLFDNNLAFTNVEH